jgi:hypothetical protein
LAGNPVKPLLSLYGTEWRERGYGLRIKPCRHLCGAQFRPNGEGRETEEGGRDTLSSFTDHQQNEEMKWQEWKRSGQGLDIVENGGGGGDSLKGNGGDRVGVRNKWKVGKEKVKK